MRQVKAWDAAAPATVTEEVSHTHWATGKGADRGETPASQAGRPASATNFDGRGVPWRVGGLPPFRGISPWEDDDRKIAYLHHLQSRPARGRG